jgi:hypothetical protein
MGNNKLVRIVIAALSLALPCAAQVLSVSRIKDPQARVIQQQYVAQLRELSTEAAALHFPYPFYFSDTLDIDEVQQKQLPTGSIRFETFHGRTVLAITGNYYASYSASMMPANLRARKTFQDVVMPVLKVAIAHMDRTAPLDAYAFEIAHHVRTRVIKVDTEGPENLMLLIPRAMAERLVKSDDIEGQQSALLESEIFLNGEPFTLWLTGDEAPADVSEHYLARHKSEPASASSLAANQAQPGSLLNARLLPESELAIQMKERAKIAPDLSPARMEKLQTTYEGVLQKLTGELSTQAHFVAYAPPAFIGFRDGAYLQLSMNTDLEQPVGSSQYRIAALAFDSHISHLLRPVSKYFHDNPQFEGVDFSTTVHQGAQPNPVSVEFVAPFLALACYEKYDCTGQELINRSVVLINGERVTLDLQRAESDVNAAVR